MKRRPAILLAILAATSACVAACYSHATNPFSDPLDPEVQAAKVRVQMIPGAFNVGVLVPFGPLDVFGMFLAAEQASAAGASRPVNIVFLDEVDYPEGTRDAKIEGMIRAGLPVIVTNQSGDALAVHEIGAPRGVLSLTSGGTSTEITSVTRPPDLLFRTVPSDAIQGTILAQLTIDQVTPTAQGATPTASIIFQEDDSYTESLRVAFRNAFVARGGVVLREEGFADDAGFTTDSIEQAIQNAFSSPLPDRVVLLALANPDPASTVILSWVGLGAPSKTSASPWVFPDAIVTPFFAENLPGAIRAAIDGTPGVSLHLGTGPGFSQFSADFQGRFGMRTVEYVSNAYDAVALLALAAERAYVVSPTAELTGAALAANLRVVANGPGTVTVTAGTASLAAGLQAIRAGTAVKYRGAYSDFGFDAVGDLNGVAAYSLVQFFALKTRFNVIQSIKITLP